MPWIVLRRRLVRGVSVIGGERRSEHGKTGIPIPVAFGVLVERLEHDRQNDFDIVADEIAEVFVVPEVEGSLGNLEVRAGDRLRELVEERLLDFSKFGRIHDFEDVFHLVEEHDFFCAVDFGPISEKTENHLLNVRTRFGNRLVKVSHLFS